MPFLVASFSYIYNTGGSEFLLIWQDTSIQVYLKRLTCAIEDEETVDSIVVQCPFSRPPHHVHRSHLEKSTQGPVHLVSNRYCIETTC